MPYIPLRLSVCLGSFLEVLDGLMIISSSCVTCCWSMFFTWQILRVQIVSIDNKSASTPRGLCICSSLVQCIGKRSISSKEWHFIEAMERGSLLNIEESWRWHELQVPWGSIQGSSKLPRSPRCGGHNLSLNVINILNNIFHLTTSHPTNTTTSPKHALTILPPMPTLSRWQTRRQCPKTTCSNTRSRRNLSSSPAPPPAVL